jgi:ubiquinone/menaquinone biosynthesis C-methylase UbiE
MVRKIYDALIRNSGSARRLRSKHWYRLVAATIKDAPVVFLNYGWDGAAPEAPPRTLRQEDEPNRLSIQLYRRVIGAVDLAGREVAEVGCGRGGGAAYVMRYHRPKSFVGVDLTERNLRFCGATHKARGLTFVPGDAERLPFAGASFDAVLNVESSHCYGRMDCFLGEVRRVLRPAGAFLFADVRFSEDLPALRGLFHRCGLAIDAEQDLTPGVVCAMEQDTERRLGLVERHAPPWLARLSRQWAGVKGSPIHQALTSGRMAYPAFVLRRA